MVNVEVVHTYLSVKCLQSFLPIYHNWQKHIWKWCICLVTSKGRECQISLEDTNCNHHTTMQSTGMKRWPGSAPVIWSAMKPTPRPLLGGLFPSFLHIFQGPCFFICWRLSSDIWTVSGTLLSSRSPFTFGATISIELAPSWTSSLSVTHACESQQVLHPEQGHPCSLYWRKHLTHEGTTPSHSST